MRPEEAAELAKKRPVPWDDLRAARVQRRVLAEVRSRRGGARRPGFSRPVAWAVAAAALLVALVVVVARLPRGGAPARLDFADGSFVTLDASAKVVPSVISPDRIEVRQSQGSASYEITPHPERLFVVLFDDVRVEVLGTAFRVEPIEKAVRVSVQRGHVRVSRGSRTVSLLAGEDVTLGNADPARSADAERSAGLPAEAPPSSPASPSSPLSPSSSSSSSSSSSLPVAETAAPTATPKLEQPPIASGAAEGDPGPAELFRRADSARSAGNTTEALRLLNLLAARYPRDGRRALAVFTVGRLEAQRGNHARAAAAFESLGSSFGGEALAEAALSYSAAGQSGKAKTLATQYSSQFPEGPRARQLARLLE